MAYKYSFADNEIYGASDINAITKRLVTSGVADSFTDGVAYNVSRFNEAGKLLYTSGIVPENCLTLKVENAESGRILINPGKAFFDDGAVIEIEEGGETLSYVSGSKNYVYLKNDLINTNRCYPCCTVAEPEGDYVLLAEINANGKIADKRTYAKGKLSGYQSVAGNVMRIQESIRITGSGKTLNGSATFDIGANNFEYILVMRTGDLESSNRNYLGVYNIAANSYIGFRNRSDDINLMSTSSLYVYSSNSGGNTYRDVTFSLENGILTVNMRATSYYNYDEVTYIFPIDLILF
jgi:hypothetical protein